MSTKKQLAEMALNLCNRMQSLPVHEQAAVIQMMTAMLQAEARSLELAQVETRPPMLAPPADEHYRQ